MQWNRFKLVFALLCGLGMPLAALAQDGGAAASAGSSAAAGAAATAGTATAGASASADAGATAGTTAGTTAGATGVDAPAAGLTMSEGETQEAFLQRVMEARSTAADEEIAKVGAGEVKPGETKPGEEKPADEKTDEKTDEKADEKTDDETVTEDDDDLFAEPGKPVLPKDLNDKINANPAFKAALDADPELRQSLIENSRLAAETDAFKKVFPTAEQAQIAAAGNAEFTAISDLVTSISKPEDAQAFYGKLLELSVLQDDEGNPILKDGKPQSDGTVGRLIHHTGALFLNHFKALAQSSGNEELAAAVDILEATAFGKPAGSGGEELSEKEKELNARVEAQNQREATARQEATAKYEKEIETGIDDFTNGEIGKLLGRTDVTDKDRADLSAKILKAAYELVADNPQFQREQDQLTRRAAGPKTKEARIGLGKKWVQTVLPGVARQLIADHGAKIIAKQKAAAATQTAREEASRSETQGSLKTPKPVQASSAQDVTKNAIDTLTAKLGRAPSSAEMVAEIMRVRGGGQ